MRGGFATDAALIWPCRKLIWPPTIWSAAPSMIMTGRVGLLASSSFGKSGKIGTDGWAGFIRQMQEDGVRFRKSPDNFRCGLK